MLRHAIVIGIFCSCLGFAARAEEKEADDKVLLQLGRVLPEINFSGQGLADVLDFMRDVAGANIFIDWQALGDAGIDKDAPVKLQLKNAKFRAALKGILDTVGTAKGKAELSVQEGVIVISTVPDPAHPRAGVAMGKLPAGADRMLPEINFGGQAFSDVIDFLRDVSGLKIQVDWTALKQAGISKDAPVIARVRDVKFSTALRFVLESVSDGKSVIECSSAGETLKISAKPMAKKADEKRPEK
jgi:hypothetical protein